MGQQLAEAAAEVATVRAAAPGAARTADRAGFGAEETFVAAPTQIAHQVHGAAGLVHRQRLATLTARLWAWRDEDGTEGQWGRLPGELALQVGGKGCGSSLPDSQVNVNVDSSVAIA